MIERPRDRFRPDGPGRFKWEFANLRPTKADDIRVVIEPGYTSYDRPGFTEDQNLEPRPKSVLEYRLEAKRYFVDHDDLCAPDRLTLQMAVFDADPALGCLGGRIRRAPDVAIPAWFEPLRHFVGALTEIDDQ